MSRYTLDLSWQMTGHEKMLQAQLKASYDEQEILVQALTATALAHDWEMGMHGAAGCRLSFGNGTHVTATGRTIFGEDGSTPA